MTGDSSNTQETTQGRSSQDSFANTQDSRTTNITGVDLAHPPASIEKLPDVDKRFLAGMIREGYSQGLELCQRQTGSRVEKRTNLRYADQWIAGNVPFLSGVIGDVSEGGSSNR